LRNLLPKVKDRVVELIGYGQGTTVKRTLQTSWIVKRKIAFGVMPEFHVR